MLQGALHLHSTYSDGEFSLAELRDMFRAAGCRFACVTDHADAFIGDEAKREAYVRECNALSSDGFRFVPGLEYTCADGMHVLGYGTTQPIDSSDLQEVVRRIDERGGIAVVAHPKQTSFSAIESLEFPPAGIEVWNSKYDGRYAPRRETFELVRRVRSRSPRTWAFYGQDLHWRRQYRGLFVFVDCVEADPPTIVAALRAGRFHAEKDRRTLPADGILDADALAAYARRNRRSQLVRKGARSVKRWLEGLGLAVPPAVKEQLRRIF